MMNFSIKQALAARFLIGVSWGLVYSDSIVNAREYPGMMVFMTIVTMAFGAVSALERSDSQ